MNRQQGLRAARDAGRVAGPCAVRRQSFAGSLPCPEVNDDGKLTLGVDFTSGGACTQYIGRLPWKTLELPETSKNRDRLYSLP
jgi:hypothetical protein